MASVTGTESPVSPHKNSEAVDTNSSVTPVSACKTTPGATVMSSGQKRRSSTRSIKRKKFDDELVESSLTPSQPKIEKIIKAKENKSATSTTTKTSSTAASTISTAVTTASTASVSTATTVTTSTTSSHETQAASAVSVALGSDSNAAGTSKQIAQDASSASTTASGDADDIVMTTTIKTQPLTISVPALEIAAAELEASKTSELKTVKSATMSPITAPRASSTTPLATSSATPPTTSETQQNAGQTPGTPTVTPSTSLPSPSLLPLSGEKKKPSKGGSSKRSKKTSKPPPAASTKDLGRWKPQDDLLLISAVQQTSDLTAVFLGCKFSCKFTLREIQERWYALLYDPVLSKLAMQAMNQLHPDVVSQVQTKALFSKEEESLLGTIASNHFQNSQPNLETFQEMLGKKPGVFHPTRTAKTLQTHWLLMRQYHLLPDQTVQPMPRGDHVLNFSDAEDLINDEELREVTDEALEHELTVADRRQKKEIRHLESELPKWQVLVDSVTGISPQEFDNQTLAVLRGRLVRYLMRSKEITIGRSTKDNPIDVDLSLEGPAWKISRRQGIIKLKNNGEFYIANEGKRPIYVDGKPIIKGTKQKLNNNSVMELSCLRFIFLINQDLINMIRQESQKIPT